MARGSFPDFVDQVRLIDHHVHGAFQADSDEARFQNSLNEGHTEPLAHPEDAYNTQIGQTEMSKFARQERMRDNSDRVSPRGEHRVSDDAH